MVPGAEPRTSTPATAPASLSTTVQPVGRSGMVKCPTLIPGTSVNPPDTVVMLAAFGACAERCRPHTAIAWLATMGRALRREPRPVLVGLFAAAVIQLWPIASTTGFYTLPVAGWSFLLLGWGMAEARWGGGG